MANRVLPDGFDWPDRTIAWFQAWVDSPSTAGWSEIQWEYLADTALVHAYVWGNSDMAKIGELRARVERMGGMPTTALPVAPATQGPAPEKVVTPLDELAQRRATARSSGA